jgi:DNA-binding XRE family transcriptional regulator
MPIVFWFGQEMLPTLMSMVCPNCLAPLDLKRLLETWIETVEGRKAVRLIVQQADKRLKARPPRQANPGPEVLPRVVAHLVRLRQEACLSQAVLAKEVGVSEYTVHRWESRLRGPGLDDCIKWARVLGTSLEDVLETVNESPNH